MKLKIPFLFLDIIVGSAAGGTILIAVLVALILVMAKRYAQST